MVLHTDITGDKMAMQMRDASHEPQGVIRNLEGWIVPSW